MPTLRFSAIVLLALLAACTRQISMPGALAPGAPADFPAQRYVQAVADGKRIFRIDGAASLAVITVRRGGPLARFGHDHVVASHDMGGYLSVDEREADLYIPLDRLSVDEAMLRAEEALDTQPSTDDIAGTRQNMLEKVLETARHPFARVHVSGDHLLHEPARLNIALTLHDITRSLQLPAEIELAADRITVAGRFDLEQSAFGITPFSVLGGALTVEDRVTLRFRIVAHRLDAGSIAR